MCFLFQEPKKSSFYFLNKSSFIVVVFYPETVFSEVPPTIAFNNMKRSSSLKSFWTSEVGRISTSALTVIILSGLILKR